MIFSNYHTHTFFSDGKRTPKDYCFKAMELGFHSLGFSDHAPVLFPNKFSIDPNEFENYINALEKVRTEFAEDLKVYISIEADYIPGYTHPFDYFREKAKLDYIIGSIHLVYQQQKEKVWFIDGGEQKVWDEGLKEVFDGDIKKGVTAFYEQTMEMIETQKPEVVGHLDKIKMHNKNRFFNQTDAWYKNMVEETLLTIKNNNAVLEVNTRGLYKGRCVELFPSKDILLKAQKIGIPIMLSSDAHHPDELNGKFETAIMFLQKIGIGELYEFHSGNWKAQLI